MGISRWAVCPPGEYAGSMSNDGAARRLDFSDATDAKAKIKAIGPSLVISCPSAAELDVSGPCKKHGARLVVLDQPGGGAEQSVESYLTAWRWTQKAIAASEQDKSQWHALVCCVHGTGRSPVVAALLLAALAGEGDDARFDVERALKTYIRANRPDVKLTPAYINAAERALKRIRQAASESQAAKQAGDIRGPWWPFDRR